MKIALFCLETSRDDFGHLRIRCAFCVIAQSPGSGTHLTVK
jgi:hypothetical protein